MKLKLSQGWSLDHLVDLEGGNQTETNWSLDRFIDKEWLKILLTAAKDSKLWDYPQLQAIKHNLRGYSHRERCRAPDKTTIKDIKSSRTNGRSSLDLDQTLLDLAA